MNNFPWRKYTKKELLDEYDKLKTTINKKKQTKIFYYSRIGLLCSNYFFQYERLNTPSQGKISCIEFWKKNKNKIIKYNKQPHIKNDLFSNIVFLNHAPSQFCILVAMQLYKYFKPKKILDPYAGWGDRCLAAMAMDIDYIGIDSNIRLKKLFDKMINFYPTNSNIDIYYNKSEKVNLDKIDYDFVFTSPPYWNKKYKILEEYNKSEKDYHKFINESLIPVIKKCLNKNVWICVNMPNHMYNDVKKVIGTCKKTINFNSGSNLNSKNTSNTNNKIYCFFNR